MNELAKPKILFCPKCNFQHVDRNEWATTKLHKTHLCEKCKHEWRPFEYYTVGVEVLDDLLAPNWYFDLDEEVDFWKNVC